MSTESRIPMDNACIAAWNASGRSLSDAVHPMFYAAFCAGYKAAAPAPAVAAEPASPMSKMAAVLREKARNEREAFDARVQSGEWGPMPDAWTEADHTPEHVATVEGYDAVREMRWNPRVAAFDFAVGTKLYAQAAPAVAAEPLTERQVQHILRTIHETFSRVMLTRETGPYNINEPTFVCMQLVRAIERHHGVPKPVGPDGE